MALIAEYDRVSSAAFSKSVPKSAFPNGPSEAEKREKFRPGHGLVSCRAMTASHPVQK